MNQTNETRQLTTGQRVGAWIGRVLPVLIVAAVVIGLDQWTKIWVRDTIPKYDYTFPIPAIADFFRFHHVDNYGAAFGILQGMGSFFVVVAFIVSLAIVYYAGTLPANQRLLRLLLGMQMGGALGNVIDRLYQGYVTDFVQMGIPGFYYIPNYNIADASIVCGVIGLGILLFAEDIRRAREERTEEATTRNGAPTAPATGSDQ